MKISVGLEIGYFVQKKSNGRKNTEIKISKLFSGNTFISGQEMKINFVFIFYILREFLQMNQFYFTKVNI